MYIFEISTEALQDETFQPTLSLREEKGAETLFHSFAITETLETEDLALEQARRHAVSEAKKMGLTEEDFEITVT